MNVTDTLKGANVTQLADNLKLPTLNFHASNHDQSQVAPSATYEGQFVSEDQPDTFAFRLINREAAGQAIGTEPSQYLHVRYVNSAKNEDALPTIGNVTEMTRQIATYLKGQLVAGGSPLTIDQVDVKQQIGGMEENTRINIPGESWEQGLLATRGQADQRYTINLPETVLSQNDKSDMRRTG